MTSILNISDSAESNGNSKHGEVRGNSHMIGSSLGDVLICDMVD
jgi:hypothetical protein